MQKFNTFINMLSIVFRNSALLINRWPSFALRWYGPIVWMNLLPNRLSEISPFLFFIQKVFLSNWLSGWLRCPIVYLNGSLVQSSSCLPKWAPCQFVYRNCSLVKMSVWLVHFSNRLSEWFSCSIVPSFNVRLDWLPCPSFYLHSFL